MTKRVPGVKDILPQEAYQWQEIENIGRAVFSIYNYSEIRLPVIEEAALFDRSLGQASDIVQKQMFLIKRDQDLYALRPEGTASVVRAYIENNLDKTEGFVKLYYVGPMFRAERPQKGRLRQFHHIGCEAIGSYGAGLDIEVISLAHRLLNAFSVTGYKIKINSLGCSKDKKELSGVLKSGLKDKINKLCADCQSRFERNVLRVLDCKNDSCRQVVAGLDIHNNYLCADCKGHFDTVKNGLDSLKIDYEITPGLVRGLDYYTRTVFEIAHSDLGAQDALGAGGRYDNLVKELGGPDAGAIGFALGVERLLLVTKLPSHQVTGKKLVYLVTMGEEAKKEGMNILDNLRKNSIACDTDYENKSLKAAMRKANDLGAKYVLIIGEDELKKNTVMLKDMVSGEQREVGQDILITELKKIAV